MFWWVYLCLCLYVSFMSQGHFKGFPSGFPGMFRKVLRLVQVQGYAKDFSGSVLQGCFELSSWFFHVCFNGALMVFKEYFTDVSCVFIKCFQTVKKIKQRSSKVTISMVIHICFRGTSKSFLQMFSRVSSRFCVRFNNVYRTNFEMVFIWQSSQLPEHNEGLFALVQGFYPLPVSCLA